MKKYFKMFLFVSVLLISTVSAIAEKTVDLTVEITGDESFEGNLIVSLWNQEAGFLEDDNKPFKRIIVKSVYGKKKSVIIKGLQPGVYAVGAIDDENKNNELDSNALGMPTESYGFANEAKSRQTFRAPTYSECAVKITENMVVKVLVK